jgi:plasmid stabilization system protein ParE
MSGPAVLAPRARQELRAAVRWIGTDNLTAARSLGAAVDKAARLIGTRPQAGRTRLELAPDRYRFWSLPAFSILLVYDTETDPIEILRIVHTARDLPKALADLRS